MSPLTAISLVALGLVPSFSWMALYLKKDLHPEPSYLIYQTFILGMISAPFVIAFQMLFPFILGIQNLTVVSSSPPFLLWAAFIEEFFKFLVIWFFIIHNREFDEPIDAMIYMIVAGLGFAAMENILFLFNVSPEGIEKTLGVWALRFVGATFLHALSAALMGYFIAMAWFFRNHTWKLIFIGIILATLFHFTFNLLLLESIVGHSTVAYSLGLVFIFSFLISILFQRLWKRQENSPYPLNNNAKQNNI